MFDVLWYQHTHCNHFLLRVLMWLLGLEAYRWFAIPFVGISQKTRACSMQALIPAQMHRLFYAKGSFYIRCCVGYNSPFSEKLFSKGKEAMQTLTGLGYLSLTLGLRKRGLWHPQIFCENVPVSNSVLRFFAVPEPCSTVLEVALKR